MNRKCSILLLSNILSVVSIGQTVLINEVNSLMITDKNWHGNYFESVPVTLEAIPAPGYRFLRWEGGLTDTVVHQSYEVNQESHLVAVFEPTYAHTGMIINEFYSHSEGDDWVELVNMNDKAIELNNWQLRTRYDKIELQDVQLESGDFLLIYGNKLPTTYRDRGKPVEVDYLDLSSEWEQISLYDPSGFEMDRVNLPASPFGTSWSLLDPPLDNGQLENWYMHFDAGTPGERNDQLAADFKLIHYPNPTSRELTIHYMVHSEGPVKIMLLNLSGGLEAVLLDREEVIGQYSLRVDLSKITPGVYLLAQETKDGITSSKILIDR